MAKTSRDAHRHVRELSRFFSDAGRVTKALVDDFVKEYEKSKYLKQSLNRFIEKGMILERGSEYVVSEKGAGYFKKFRLRKKSKGKWDGKWRLVSFDVPGNYSVQRDQLRALLKEFDFYPLQKSVWICPNYMTQNFWELVVEKDLDKYCKIMLIEFLEGEAELRNRFNLT